MPGTGSVRSPSSSTPRPSGTSTTSASHRGGVSWEVGADGLVVATDIDMSWLGESVGPWQARRHDVGREAPPAGDLDLVPARLVLTHVPQPLLCPNEHDPAERLANRLRRGFRERLIARGVATAAEIDEHLENLTAGRLPDLATSPLFSAWGRRMR